MSAPRAAVTAASSYNCSYMHLKTHLIHGEKQNLPVLGTPQAPLALFGTLKSQWKIEERLCEVRDRP